MNGVDNIKSPPLSLVLVHYLTGSIVFLLICFLLFFGSDAFIGHYFHPKLLAITHLLVLGWGSMIIFGASYQLMPVLADKALYSVRLGYWSYALVTPGILLLSYGFWTFQLTAFMIAGGILLFAGFFLYALNVFLTLKGTSSTEKDFIVTSLLWLLFTAGLGLALVLNLRYAFFSKPHLEYLKVHAHIGLVGWFLLLIMGVASKLFPMFLLSSGTCKKKLGASHYMINMGLLLFIYDKLYMGDFPLMWIWALMITIGLVLFGTYIREAYQKRIRKEIDLGLKHSFLSLLFLLIPVTAAFIISTNIIVNEKWLYQIYLVYGASIILGFITSIILGQTFKTLPFIIWLDLHKREIKLKGEVPKSLYSEPLLRWQYVFYILGITILFSGILISFLPLIKAGSIILILVALLYNSNVITIMLRRFNYIHANIQRSK